MHIPGFIFISSNQSLTEAIENLRSAAQTAPSIEASDVPQRDMMTTSLYHCLSKLAEVMQLNMVTENLPHGGGSHSMTITLHKLAVEFDVHNTLSERRGMHDPVFSTYSNCFVCTRNI